MDSPSKSIHTLIPDIYELVKQRGWMNGPNDSLSQHLSEGVSVRIARQYSEQGQRATLRMSRLGAQCPCALWHSIHRPEMAEPLPPWAEIKYSYGHLIEALALTLAKAAGHSVQGEQDEVSVDGIVGHRDAIIDGCLVDVKSSSSRGMDKFKKISASSLDKRDDFGYLEQLDGYLLGSRDHDLLKVKDRGYILAIDKTLGHMVLYEHEVREEHIRRRIQKYKETVALNSPPSCECGSRTEGKSGNIALDTKASYSAFKYCCFPNLRTFLYASGPVYLTHVVRKPDIVEVDKHGKIVYN